MSDWPDDEKTLDDVDADVIAELRKARAELAEVRAELRNALTIVGNMYNFVRNRLSTTEPRRPTPPPMRAVTIDELRAKAKAAAQAREHTCANPDMCEICQARRQN